MSLLITAGEAELIQSGVWQLEMPPHQIRLFGDCRRAEGDRSVLLVSAARFDADAKTLTFDAGAVTPLNLGRSRITIVIGENASTVAGNEYPSGTGEFQIGALASSNAVSTSSFEAYGAGDREYLTVVKEMPQPGRLAAELLLAEVRKQSPGDLKRGLQRNFSNTPDNFWYVVVQPRKGELSVTVRGGPAQFSSESLTLKPDRPGYTRFKVARPDDVAEAIQIIFSSKRRM